MNRTQHLKVMLVDKDESFLSLMRLIVQSNGPAEISLSRTAQQALTTFESFKPDLVFMDITLSGMEGSQVLHGILDKRVACRILIVTALSQESVWEYISLPSSIGYIGKNMPIPMIRQAVRNALNCSVFSS
ncbi:MAG: response regulator [Magnetococcales bacterium]|nr:response regulator [Magnetococcales bacterium]